MGFISGRHFTKQRKKLLQANDKLYEGVELPTRNIRSSTEHRDYQVSTWVNDGGWKRSLAGEYRKSPAFAGYHIFVSAGHIERYMEEAIFKFYETKKDDPIMAATNLFGEIINIHPFEDRNGRICRLILAHVLIQMKYCLFPVILSSFHRRGRRHYIRAVKMFDRKPSMLYTMIVKSLVHCWIILSKMQGCQPDVDTKMLVGTYPRIKNDLAGAQNLIKMSSVMPFFF